MVVGVVSAVREERKEGRKEGKNEGMKGESCFCCCVW